MTIVKHIIPAMLVAFDLVGAVVCVFCRDWARAFYWASAGAITASTIMMKG